MKLPILVELERQIAAGTLSWTESLRAEASAMIAVSDNTAANQIAEAIHPQSVNDTMAQARPERHALLQPVRPIRAARPSPGQNQTTPANMARLLEFIATDQIVSPQVSADIRTLLAHNVDRSKLVAPAAARRARRAQERLVRRRGQRRRHRHRRPGAGALDDRRLHRKHPGRRNRQPDRRRDLEGRLRRLEQVAQSAAIGGTRDARVRDALAARAARLADALHLALDQQKVLRRQQVHVALERQVPLLGRPALEVQQPRRERFGVDAFARLERQVRLGVDPVRERIVLALAVDPGQVAVLEVGRGDLGRGRERSARASRSTARGRRPRRVRPSCGGGRAARAAKSACRG